MMDQRINVFLYLMLLAFAAQINAQDQSGFISIDCGIPENSNYTDKTTGISYISDVGFVDTGVSKSISPLYNTNGLDQQFTNLRSFPDGIKNCYTVTPPQKKGYSRYFVRAGFMYGDYDNKNVAPTFDIYLGVDYWDTISLTDSVTYGSIEILYVPPSSYTHVCLVNTGKGTPFISVLELRLVVDDIYKTASQSSFALSERFDLRSYDNKKIIRYGDDIYDRVWAPSFYRGAAELSTTLAIVENSYTLPSVVMRNAITVQDLNDSIAFYWKPLDSTSKYFVFFHFADFQTTQVREFNITRNGDVWYGPFRPKYLSTTTVFSPKSVNLTWFNFTIVKTADSVLPPMLNALETYIEKDISTPLTNQKDVDAIKSIKLIYGVKKNWQGDPCSPANFPWFGVTCFKDISNIQRISSLNLSLSGLSGTISPSIVNLEMLQSLDLSNNKLTGEVPTYLSQMQKLTVLNLSGNNFTGTVPSELYKKYQSGSLKLSVEGNQNLCLSDPCKSPNSTLPKKNSMLPIIGAIVGVLIVLVIISVLVWFCIIKKRNPQPKEVSSIYATNVSSGTHMDREDGPILTQRQNYTYAEVVQMTRNFERELGKGGFGSVFHGSIENKQVAVKMLSPSSAQGYKQFKAEAELLMRVHHGNLTTLVGYCDEGDKLGLIYEFMANGDLETHLSDKSLKCLSWVLRLEIVVDAAHGLEYLHHGCKPPIIHRDIKTTNILLNQEMQAKLADFGLSKAFPADGGHVSTAFAGTPGYFDPEFNMNETSDVYSFGVVLLEVLTGKPPIAKVKERTHLSKWVGQTLEINGDVREVVDRRLGNDFDSNSAWKLVDVAMECASPASAGRPTMNQVVIELKRCLEMERARLEKDSQNETNYESTEYNSTLNIEMPGMNPAAR